MTSVGSRTKTGSLIDVIDVIFAVRSMVIEHATSVGNRTQIYSLINVIVVVEGGVICAIVLQIQNIGNVIVAIAMLVE